MITMTTAEPCQHANGWYYTVRFWIFKRRIFGCSDCGEVIYGNEKS